MLSAKPPLNLGALNRYYGVIKYTIVKEQPKLYQAPALPYLARLDKFAYARHIENLPFGRLDIVVHSSFDECPKHPAAFFIVKDIQELHTVVEYESANKPKCLWVQNSQNAAFWTPSCRWQLAPKEWLTQMNINGSDFFAHSHNQ